MKRRVHLCIEGHVQGVSFRWAARRQAQALGLAGWVRNCPDGSVEAVAEGESGAVDHFVAWAHHGPSGASVERVQTQEEEPSEESASFRIVS